ncbi:hypothetical protein [Enterobacter hormaechei]|uniref:Phage protein n=1 Tax=Enterobacter hormaechei TaxID=158836 RepID=A0AAP8GML9_9ENTR|nr:hypothetical protein [Enterobacter hormaechei]HAS1884740.1 hypothetical protein [Enterobacter hormaechei subsp. xiangfangensis]MCM8478011.1 hypothetical protein [Enterobacter hormaechei]MDF3588121.1 hypothetical protein [Enterobacter hormaechei]PJG40237.1 hypothetical protein CGZ54_08430 [Enterobacter hormaechei]HBM2753136.1 hypothetical protein [Enterobacter hormaechei subsp. xiangfangensis]
MAELTKEWLQQTIAELEEERDAVPGVVNEDAARALAAMKRALASLEAEAIGFAFADDLDLMRKKKKIGGMLTVRHHGEIAVYTAPPVPESVPDGVLKSLLPDAEKSEFWFEHDGKILFEGVKFNNAVFDACRAAMLQGADGNSPVIPDGWVMVPVELTGAMTNAMTDAILDDLHNVDVWRSVLAAAPQREVK